MSRYELMFIISPKVKEADLRSSADQINKMIPGVGGKIIEELDWGKKKLAYPIKNYRHGFYYVIYFDAEAAGVEKIQNSLKQNDDLLRYLLIKLEASAVKALSEQKKRALEHPEEAESDSAETTRPAAKPTAAKNAPAKITPEKPNLTAVKEKPAEETEAEPIATIATEPQMEAKPIPKVAAKKDTSVSQEKQEKAKLDELDKKLDEILDEDITD